MNALDPVNYDTISNNVRSFCAERYYELEKTLRPLVDPNYGDVLPGHLNAYLAAVKQLGQLYQAHKPPLALQNLVPMAKVQELIAGMEERHRLEVAAAVSAAEARVRQELSQGSKLSVQAAMSTVSTRLLELEQRVAGTPAS